MGPPSIGGRPSAPPSPEQPWQPPRGTVPPEPPTQMMRPALAMPPEAAARADRLTLPDVVDIALRHNPQTQISWAEARAAVETFGASRGSFLPSLDGTSNLGRTQSTSTNGGINTRSTITPTLTLSYLLFDFGGRSGAVSAARENAIALDLTHNSTLQTVVLQVETAYFNYFAARAVVVADSQTVLEAQQNLTAAEQRHEAGVATIADVLQAQTVLAQAQLDLETAEGNVQTTRGALASAMGLPANARFDVAPVNDSLPIGVAAADVDSLIARAVATRPDLAAARVDILQSEALVRVAKSAQLPALTIGASAGRAFSDLSAFQGPNYGITLGVQLPLFNGFARQYQVAAAQSQVQATAARANLLRTQIANQVFSSYYSLRTATLRAHTADVLLASATQSESVAQGRYRAGVGTILDLLTAQAALANARSQQAQTRWTWARALAQLAHDVGVLGTRGEIPIPLVRDTTGIRR
ncbi:MAG: TolC family protein [Gemmatimonadota bacterium]|nr:TolC family protein [Gemmatimonadota bacterium]